tara:strand:- start:853 stop:1740 length:888 start_codon:yes stop_codon:yes gene_type:complete
MIRIFYLTFIFIFFALNVNLVFAGHGGNHAAKGNADVYKVIMRKIELCTGYTVVDFDDVGTDAACHDAVVIGSGDKTVDIASVSAGAAAANYGDPTLLPLGVTYTHMRVTIDKKFVIKSESAVDTGGEDETDNCVTVATTNAQYGSNEAARKYTHKVAVAEGGTNAAMNLYMTNGRQAGESGNTYTQCEAENCSKSGDWSWNYAKTSSDLSNNGSSAVAMSTARASVTTDDLLIVYALSSPYTVTLDPPKIDISFGTRSALGVQEVCDNGSNCAGQSDAVCSFYPESPIVTITIQ